VLLAGRDEQGVELVEQRGIGGKMSFQEGARVLVARRWRQQAMACEHPAGVGVGDEHRPAGRVEQDRVHGFRPEPGHPEHLSAELLERRPAQPIPAPAPALHEPGGQSLEPPCLHPVGARGADRLRQLGFGDLVQASRREPSPGAQGGDGARSAGPRRVLREHRAHGHLVGRSARPPVLRAEAPQQRHVQAEQPRLDRVGRRTGNPPVAQPEA
jgi:hypothetical protein